MLVALGVVIIAFWMLLFLSVFVVWPLHERWKQRAPKRPRDNARTFDTRASTWGNNVQWWDFEQRRVYGWTSPIPVVGDVLKSPMRSGKVGLFVFTKVDWCRDPEDMFFADVQFHRYATDDEAPYITEGLN